jgi:signal transduction histidine kinase
MQNIIKHSGAKKVRIEILQKNTCLQLNVADNGVGFDITKQYCGSGLKNLQQRAADMAGESKIISEIGKGTTVVLTTKIP